MKLFKKIWDGAWTFIGWLFTPTRCSHCGAALSPAYKHTAGHEDVCHDCFRGGHLS